MVRAVLRVFKVKVTVSKNALKPRLFSIGTPFLTLGSLGEQEAPWREECEQARHTSNPHTAALQIQSTQCCTLSHTAALQIQHRTTICKCIHSPLGGEFHRRVAATINEMPVFLLSGPFSDTSCNHTACDHWVTTRGNWQVSGRSSCFVLIQICQNIQRQFVAVLPIAATNRMSVELLNTEAKAHSHRAIIENSRWTFYSFVAISHICRFYLLPLLGGWLTWDIKGEGKTLLIFQEKVWNNKSCPACSRKKRVFGCGGTLTSTVFDKQGSCLLLFHPPLPSPSPPLSLPPY